MTKNCNSEGIKQFNGHKLRGFHLMSVLLLLTHFTISVFDYTDCPCFEVKDEEDLLSEKTVQLDGTKPVEVKDRINDYETCESEEWLQRLIILCTKREA